MICDKPCLDAFFSRVTVFFVRGQFPHVCVREQIIAYIAYLLYELQKWDESIGYSCQCKSAYKHCHLTEPTTSILKTHTHTHTESEL